MITRKKVGGYPSTLVDKAVRLWWAGAICLVLAVASILWVCYHAMPLWAAAPKEDDELAANAKALEEYDWIVYWKTNDRPAESPNVAISHDPHLKSSPDNPDGSGNSGPMRIFPCKKTYDDQHAPLRQYVLAVAEYKLGESPPTVMYFRLWDVDDPSADGPPIDTRPTADPGENGPDNWVNDENPVDKHKIASESDATKHFTVAVPRGYVIRFKEDGSWEQQEIEGDNADRLYMVEVKVGMQPGDNYRFTASPELPNLLEPLYMQHNADVAHLPANGRISKKLTVWRKLHVEVDSMGPEYDTGTSTGLTDTTLTDTTKNWAANQFNSYNENWNLNPDTSEEQPNWFDVTDTTATVIIVAGGSQMTNVASQGDAYKVEFKGFPPPEGDDLLRGEIPQPDTDAFADAFDDAYIVPVFDTGNNSTATPWHYDFYGSVTDMVNYAASHKATIESAAFWVAYIIGIYETYETDHDNDDDTEACAKAFNYEPEPEYALVCLEVERDVAKQHGWSDGEKEHSRQGAALHEIGHHFELQDEGGEDKNTHVMWAAGTDAQEDKYKNLPLIFKEADIAEIRRCASP